METLVASGVQTLHSIGTLSPSSLSRAPPAGQQVHPPQGPALAICVGGLSRPYALPLSVLSLRHVKTFCGVSQGSGGYLPPTWPALQGTAPCPLIFWFLRLTGPL